MDPFAVLGVPPDAAPDELAEAYRRLARRWHPDRGRGPEAHRRMAEVNAAYDAVRRRRFARRPERGPGPRERDAAAGRPARWPLGTWLPEAVRRSLGRELLAALQPGEEVTVVTPVSTFASPAAVLAVTDRRLLWLLDDAVTGRVRSLGFSAIADVEHRLSWPRRRRAVLRLRTKAGRRLSFAELRPDTAAAIAGHVTRASA